MAEQPTKWSAVEALRTDKMDGRKKSCARSKSCVDCGQQFTLWIWGPHWCPECDAKRIDRISASMEGLLGNFSV